MAGFRIATYNVNSLRSRLHILLPWLRENRPDVVCLQETKVGDDKFPREEFTAAGYEVVFRGNLRYNGVAVASLEKPIAASCGLDDGESPDEDRLLRVDFPDFSVVNTYVPQGRERETPHFAYKLAWFDRLRAYFSRNFTPGQPLIWCGDLNVAPEDIDVHDPQRLRGHVCFTPEVWEAFDRVKAWGFIDVFRRHHPGEAGQYTFFDYRVPRAVERQLGWRVDHILATAPLAERSRQCRIDMAPRRAEKPSDHTVVLAEFAAE
ncbi:MAG TPA: exodeoxyribonuclease III [Syntrophales bacterium]|jgi:exodeoxyribonuclease-3|nr:exodeoxyribonuclease III [Syntrophales bacterium]HON23749.1 exodeoxyribonuclease III [Syntrophales bacterium]HOU76799.1 exodeoxyribonuclease III [Syntrophales bacterium]HPC32365.1 exodeoxyribonuclease III [Syntrophales bacterium]HQG33584.1 exodeoxyribonuclease III [Syntrophales bacterium]